MLLNQRYVCSGPPCSQSLQHRAFPTCLCCTWQHFLVHEIIRCCFLSAHASLLCRFVGGIRSEVEKLEKTLLLFSENLDEWLAVQRSWMYLESIFGAPDIQRQLPGPAKAFQVIDKEFRSIMRSVKQKPLALAVCLLLVLCIMSGRQKPHYYSMCCKHTVLSCGKWIRKCLLEQNLWKAVGSEYCSIRKCSQFCVMRP